MRPKFKSYHNLLVFVLWISIFTIFLLPDLLYSNGFIKLFSDQNLSLSTKFQYALKLAIKKYDGRKIWLIYYTDSIRKQIKTSANIFTYKDSISYLTKQDFPDKNSQLLILDYSLESGRPLLYKIYHNDTNAIEIEKRPTFWLGKANSAESLAWLLKNFHETKNSKLKLDIVKAVGWHNCTSKVVSFQKKILFSDASVSLKKEAILALSHHNSTESIKILSYLAVKLKDTKLRKQAIFSLSQIKNEKSQAVIMALAKKDRVKEIRQEAIFWLSQIANEEAIEVLKNIVDSSSDQSIREYTIFAISQLPERQAAPILTRIAQVNPDLQIREKANFWLSRTREQRTLQFLRDIFYHGIEEGSN
jgi:HEAT repeat protein